MINEETDSDCSLEVMPFQDDSVSLADLRVPIKQQNVSLSFGSIVQTALCVAKVGMAKLMSTKADNCSV